MFAVEAARDFWDWVSLVLGLAAGIAAVIAFVPWALSQRRRPEIRVFWSFAAETGVDPAPWLRTIPVLEVGRPVLITVALRNVGDAVADNLCWNFVAPTTLTLRKPGKPDQPMASTSATAGALPDTSVTYFFHAEDHLAPGDFTSQTYQLTFTNDPKPHDAQLRLLLDISQVRLNATGSRILPSLVVEDNEDHEAGMGPGTQWPPRVQHRKLKWVSAKPTGQLRCQLGSRSDVRDVVVHRP